MKIKHIVLALLLILITGISIYSYNKYLDQIVVPGIKVISTKNNLIIYDSTANTDKIAEEIKSRIGGKIIKLDPSAQTNVANLKKYDFIIIGSPIKENKISTATKSLLENKDLKNKIILPFASYENPNDVKALQAYKQYSNKKAIVKNGLLIKEDEIDKWLSISTGMWLNKMPFTRRELQHTK